MKKLFILVVLAISSCGTDEVKVVEVPANPDPGPVPAPGPGGSNGGSTSFSEARQIIGTYCESCHANSPWLKDADSLRASSVKGRTKNNSMPPQNAPRKIGEAARIELLKFF